MPHFRLMDSDEMVPAEAAFLRAKLHVRGGKRRVSENKIFAGIASLHDAFLSAMQRYFLASDLKDKLICEESDIDLNDEDILFSILKKSGIINSSFSSEDFHFLCLILDAALDQTLDSFNQKLYFEKFNNVMEQLGVLPFSENELPPEDPATY